MVLVVGITKGCQPRTLRGRGLGHLSHSCGNGYKDTGARQEPNQVAHKTDKTFVAMFASTEVSVAAASVGALRLAR